jgi:flagellar basal body-associated protein FliL
MRQGADWFSRCKAFLHMATTAPSLVPKKKNGRNLFLVIGVLLLAGAGAAYWFYRTKLPTPPFGSVSASDKRADTPTPVEAVTLDPFLANLSGGEGYVKLTITLSVRKNEAIAAAADKKAAGASAALLQSAIVRDTILADLSTQSAAVLLTAEGKAALKTRLKSDLVAKVPGLSLENIYFTDFLVQQ